MALPVLSPSGLYTLVVNAISALSTRLTRFDPGSATGAIVNATNAGLLQNQQQAQYLIAVSRAATSSGPDLVSFVTDYGLNPPQLPGVAASGPLLFGRYQAPAVQVVILVGTVVQNVPLAPGAPVQYQVIADVTNPDYNAGLGGYPIPSGQTTTIATVQALLVGTASNLLAGGLQTIVTAGTPADFLLQSTDFTNGQNTETDAALRIRFALYISGLAKSTVSAVDAAVASTQAGLTYSNNEYYDNAQTLRGPGYFTVVVDDGSGSIPGGLLTTIATNVNLVRAEGSSFWVVAPSNVTITIAVTGTVINAGFSGPSVRFAVRAALVAAVNANGVGNKLTYASVLETVGTFIGTGASQGLAGYAAITVNGGMVDVPIGPYQLARTSTGSVSVT